MFLLSLWAAAAAAADAPPEQDVSPVHQDRVQLDFQVAAGSSPTTDIELWYTLDLGRAWRAAAVESGTQSPVVFTARQDGLHGLYLVLHSDAGVSAPPPRPGDTPHAWVFVDRKPPIVQIRRVSGPSVVAGTRRLVIDLSAYDANLTPRPLTIDYRMEERSEYATIIADLALCDQFEWTVPAEVKGRVRVRVLARDRGGNVSVAESLSVRLDGGAAGDAGDAGGAPPLSAPSRPTALDGVQQAAAMAASQPAIDRFIRDAFEDALRRGGKPDADGGASGASGPSDIFRLASAHASRGEWEQAEERYREALSGDAERADYRLGLADALLRQRKLGGAEREYRTVLERRGGDPHALNGLALVSAAQRDYLKARDILTTLAASRPADADALIHLGDMCVLAGDSAGGRAAWTRARELPVANDDARRRAAKRLLIYPAQPLP